MLIQNPSVGVAYGQDPEEDEESEGQDEGRVERVQCSLRDVVCGLLVKDSLLLEEKLKGL
jgi:hypothetical protein